MENNHFSTNYVPLKPPYMIIKHGTKIGVQIGIQRVTIAKGRSLKIETHDYPVVAAENRFSALKDNDCYIDDGFDGEVWDNVECKQVSVLCEAGACLEWQQFIKILWHDHDRLGNPSLPINKTQIFQKLSTYNTKVNIPQPGVYTLHLYMTSSSEGMLSVIRTKEDDVFAQNVVWTENLDELKKRVESDLMEYLLVISPNRRAKYWNVRYETEEEQLRPLVDKLNADNKNSVFRTSIMASFTVRAITPYEEESSHSMLSSPEEEHGEHYYGKNIQIFHENLDPLKIAQAIMTLNRGKTNKKRIADRNFCLILYKVFMSHPACMITNEKTKLLDWVKYNCSIHFESHDLKKVNLDSEEEQMIERYHAVFADRQSNGQWIFKRQYYKINAQGDLLQRIEGVR